MMILNLHTCIEQTLTLTRKSSSIRLNDHELRTFVNENVKFVKLYTCGDNQYKQNLTFYARFDFTSLTKTLHLNNKMLSFFIYFGIKIATIAEKKTMK